MKKKGGGEAGNEERGESRWQVKIADDGVVAGLRSRHTGQKGAALTSGVFWSPYHRTSRIIHIYRWCVCPQKTDCRQRLAHAALTG
jgi:hypothetical protein